MFILILKIKKVTRHRLIYRSQAPMNWSLQFCIFFLSENSVYNSQVAPKHVFSGQAPHGGPGQAHPGRDTLQGSPAALRPVTRAFPADTPERAPRPFVTGSLSCRHRRVPPAQRPLLGDLWPHRLLLFARPCPHPDQPAPPRLCLPSFLSPPPAKKRPPPFPRRPCPPGPAVPPHTAPSPAVPDPAGTPSPRRSPRPSRPGRPLTAMTTVSSP